MKNRPKSSLFLFAVLSLACAYFVPLWQIQLWAPQYPEGLNMKIWINNLSGAFDIINGLNHYIGMKDLVTDDFTEFKWLPFVVGALALLYLRAMVLGTVGHVVDVLVRKSERALKATGLRRLVVAGGVGANAVLRRRLDAMCSRRHVRTHYPELDLCTDNGAMIALAGAMRIQRGLAAPNPGYAFDVRPRWPLDELSLS